MTRPRIRVLPDHVANQIAAGEVVERPASVVKELVENALDARAGTIQIAIKRGGKGLVRVEDDGDGMTREDALICLDRHATSKIRQAQDLREIRTLGFRGEALPSIAAVSRMVVVTAAQGEVVGTRLRVLAGRLQGVDDMARRAGTTVEVRNLFLNTPVRARFLSNVATETRLVGEVIHALALVNRDVRFTLEADGRTVLDLPAGRDLRSRIGAIWQDADEAGLMDLAARETDLHVDGAIQRPDRARPGFRRTHLFVNGRPFRNPALVAAADRGYRTTIAPGVRPWLFLFLRVPPSEVDVNVHPGKAEVRFRSRSRMEGFVEAAVRDALGEVESVAVWGKGGKVVRERPPEDYGQDATDGGQDATDDGQDATDGGEGATGHDDDPDGEDHGSNGDRATGDGAGRADGADDPDGAQMHLFPRGRDASATQAKPTPRAPRPALLQIHNSFILAETREGLIIVDQHAAHERVLYERIMADFESGSVDGQRLLFPFTIRLALTEMGVIESLREPLSRLGFEFEKYGERALLVRTVPSPHAYFNAERCLHEMVDELAHGSDLMNAARNQNERLAMSFACKGAIKAGQKLSGEEMHELFDLLFATSLPYHDIHGRPTTVSLGLDELRRSFGRT